MSGPPGLMRGWHLQPVDVRRPRPSSQKPLHPPPSPSALFPPNLALSSKSWRGKKTQNTYFPSHFRAGWWTGGTKHDKPNLFWRGKLFPFWAISRSWPDSSNLSHWSNAKTAPYTHTGRPARGVKTFFHPLWFFLFGLNPQLIQGT